jgi:hypothetical protein
MTEEKEYLRKINEFISAEVERGVAFREENRKLTEQISALNDNLNHAFELIEDYKRVLMLAGVPELIIENPAFIQGLPPTQEDIDWAMKCIEKRKKTTHEN